MEISEVSDSKASSVGNGSMQSSSSFKGSDNLGNDSAHYETFLLEEMDSYFDDIDTRLIVSRMVNDSVVKGMVNAVSEEAAEKIASKEKEVALLKGKLRCYESGEFRDKDCGSSSATSIELEKMNFDVLPDSGGQCNHIEEHLTNLKIAAEGQSRRLKEEIEEIRGFSSVSKMNMGAIQQGKIAEKCVETEESIDTLKDIIRSVNEEIDNIVLFSKASLYEWKWEQEFQEEVKDIVFQSYIRSIQKEFEAKLLKQRVRALGSQNKKVSELSSLRQELDVISRSLFSPEMGKLQSHGSHEFTDEWTNGERKDRIHRKGPSTVLREENSIAATAKSDLSENKTAGVTESQLKRMPKDELISYFKSEMTNLKRNHELTVQELTEDYFSLKREFLKEKGSSHLRKDRDLDALRKKIPEVITKLDDILVENEKLPAICDDYENICSLNDRVENLLSEIQSLSGLLADKTKEVKCLSSQVSDAEDKMLHHSSAEVNLSKQIKTLKCDMEDANIEVFIREKIYISILKESIGNFECDLEDLDIEKIIMNEMCATIFNEAIKDYQAAINHMEMKYDEEKEKRIYLEATLSANEKTLLLEIKGKEQLKEKIVSLSETMKEKVMLASEAESTLIKQREQFELGWQELNRLKDQTSQQERLISENNKESESLKRRLDEALEQIGLYKVEISKLDQKLKRSMDVSREAERQISTLHGIIKEKQDTAIASDKKQRKKMASIMVSLQELYKAMADFECRVAENIVQNNSRLEMLNCHHSPLVQQANLIKREGLVHKLMLERRCSDLQKAEAEVDLLGDEVDALLSLLEKIYIALDHYSPILQHYTGIMEILKLVRRELK
ncbi:myosin heavy chain-like protein [Tasmannia lanceolata]|uniref:myosin heavy chain-like protein n=1 Tax=Tasmannia lanceolata TaxID=3420 RepID=UPI004063BDF8